MAHEKTMKLANNISRLLWVPVFLVLGILHPALLHAQEPAETPPEEAVSAEDPAQESKEGDSSTETETTPEEPKEKPRLPQKASSLNPETLRMIEMIEKKSRELKKREQELLLREENLKLLEEKVRADLKKIEEALARSEEQVGIKRDLIEKNVKSLVKVYSAMKATEAAPLLESMDEAIAIQIISRMKSKIAGKVLARMNKQVAKTISEKIAGKREKQK